MLSPQELRRQLEVEPSRVHSPIEELIDPLSDPRNPQARRAAVMTLGQLRGSYADGPTSSDAASAWASHDGRRAVKLLLAALQDPVEAVRVAAITSLGRIGAPEAVVPLLDLLKHGNAAHRRSAAEALGEIGDPRAVEPLVTALKDTCHRVCIAALRALGRIGDRRAVEALVAALGHRDACTRLTAAAALSEIAKAARTYAQSGTVEP